MVLVRFGEGQRTFDGAVGAELGLGLFVAAPGVARRPLIVCSLLNFAILVFYCYFRSADCINDHVSRSMC